MDMKENIGQTQRAYTLRLRGGDPKDQAWRDALWHTHAAVNRGAKVFGDWLLTLRGGLDHKLADKDRKSEKSNQDDTHRPQKNRRILLALSWLSVESKLGAPQKYIVAEGHEETEMRKNNVIAALENILKKRGLPEGDIDEWKRDCGPSLSANIRSDAVWVNRSLAFDDAVQNVGNSLTRDEVWDMLEGFLGNSSTYLAPKKSSDEEVSDEDSDSKAKDLVQKAGQWLSSRFGTGKGADFKRLAEVYQKIAEWAETTTPNMTGSAAIESLAATLREFSPPSNDLQSVLKLISGPGYKSATRNLLNQINRKPSIDQEDLTKLKKTAEENRKESESKIGSKGRRPYADAILREVESECGFTYLQDEGPARHVEFAVMLDHAARRVSLAHTWVKLAEAERCKLENDAIKIEQIPEKVKAWLDRFCEERSDESGALEVYRIRPRAVDGWREVVDVWSKPDCKTEEDRIAAARMLQDNPNIQKFGDIQLFEALAAEDALCIWHRDGDLEKEPDHKLLLDYVDARDAEFKKQQFKVPAYRHPDPLLHPVFCDFGESRWKIDFSVHRAVSDLENTKKKVAQIEKQVEKEKKSLQKVSESARTAAQERLSLLEQELKKAKEELDCLTAKNRMTMTLWNGKMMQQTHLCWQSKRLAKDIGLKKNGEGQDSMEVTRADRLGRAAAKAAPHAPVKIAGLFEQNEWNGRLQAPRTQLNHIARYVEKNGWDQKAEKMRNAIKWTVTFSARLRPMGPWCEFARNAGLIPDPKSHPHSGMNKERKGLARLILCRLPGLRILSVDLGHRYAAACAVWESMSADQVKHDCRAVGCDGPTENDLFLHLKKRVKKQRKNSEVEVTETTIYRRIGPDMLPDGKPHPAPWAKLERQFIIRLQGEEEGVREASNEEIWAVHQMETLLGKPNPLIDRLVASGWGNTKKQQARLDALRDLGWKPVEKAAIQPDALAEEEEGTFRPSLAVDELMFAAVRTMRLALRRHGDRARIAHNLITDFQTMPGGRKCALNENERIELLKDTLQDWYGLFSSRVWKDSEAEQLWQNYIRDLAEYKAPENLVQNTTGMDHGKKKKLDREKFRDLACLLARDPDLRKKLHDAWKTRWEKDDVRWRELLRWFRNWIRPRGNFGDNPAIRGVGGLSLTRIATITEFRRKVQVGYFTRLRPDGSRNEISESFGQGMLDALEHLREQRVKQLASRVIEAALGVGRMKRMQKSRDPRRPVAPVDKPCHAVVIEDLTHYRPEETRTRRENRQLMNWASARVRKYLQEGCLLYGLLLREVNAAYTSRQDSRTGAPGIRCQDVPVVEFMCSPFWRKLVDRTAKKLPADEENADMRFLSAVKKRWDGRTLSELRKAGVVRIPLKGGEVFISADPQSPAAHGIQADLNAAANIGLRALMDPDWPGKWWYVPCDPKTCKPAKENVQGSAVVNVDQPLCLSAVITELNRNGQKSKGKSEGKTKNIINLWRDISSSSLDSAEAGAWQDYKNYWQHVRVRVLHILEEQLKRRDPLWPGHSEEEDLPF